MGGARGEGAWEAGGTQKLQPSAASNHDNPVSGNHPGTFTLLTSEN